jgi:hypothetical protein
MSSNKRSNLKGTREKGKPFEKGPPSNKEGSKDMEQLVRTFWSNNPYVEKPFKNDELEVRFGTRGIKPVSKIDYDNVIQKCKSLGFTCANPGGNYLLRVNSEFLDPATGVVRDSNIRLEIEGFHGIHEYCKHNDVKKLATSTSAFRMEFYRKQLYKDTESGSSPLKPVNVDDFNFRISYQTEEKMSKNSGIVKSIMDNWEKTKKSFRYLNRITLIHPDLPIQLDLSIVKSSRFDTERKRYEMTYTTEESGVFTNPEFYEIELEVVNKNVGPGTDCPLVEGLLSAIRKSVKYVLMGLQGTNYPVSYSEQRAVYQEYLSLFRDKERIDHYVQPKYFIGPSSYTLQIINIAPLSESSNVPNIRKDYTVTEKADGERSMLYISEKGHIYLIGTNMQIAFTGMKTQNKELFQTLLDGEIVLHDKTGAFINLFLAFDIYFLKNKNVRSYEFVSRNANANAEDQKKYRLPLLKYVIGALEPESVVNSNTPMRIESKKFYPLNEKDSIFAACQYILKNVSDGLFEYNTDGLIFTHAHFGVGANKEGQEGPLKKITWEYSFKWKPPQYNTIDFLVKTIKSENGSDQTTPLFQEGMDTSAATAIQEYKTVILCVGFDPKQHGYINPCQDVLDDVLPKYKEEDEEINTYRAAEFVPTHPSEPGAGIANILLKKDDTGVYHMFSEEGEVFTDDTIVEFRYDMDAKKQWRWIPLRVRYDKTAKHKSKGGNEFGNAYNVANSNWHSIHFPVTEEMICTGEGIVTTVDEDVYYNRVVKTGTTRGLRDFHNLYVKKKLITGVAKRGDILIDYACGKGGDFPKWIDSHLSFVLGIDVAKDNLENRLDGACSRFLNYRRDYKQVPYALFVNGNSGANIRNGSALLNDKAAHIVKAVFGEGAKDETRLGKAVMRQYGVAENGFHISSCQFALHYFFENKTTLTSFLRNIAECTRVGGYFIGTCYDGKSVFQLLKDKKRGESVEIWDEGIKIWEVRKEYDNDTFPDTMVSVGYKVDVYQESINKMFSEYLVNFDYLERVLEDFGFKRVTRDEAKDIGMPEGSGLFSELFMRLEEDAKRNKRSANEYGSALHMSSFEKKISFLNRYFIYKKIRNVNAAKVAIDDEEGEGEEEDSKQESKQDSKQESKQESKQDSKQESKQDSKQDSKQESKQDSKQESKQESKQDSKQESKQDSKQDSKQESKEDRKIDKELEEEIIPQSTTKAKVKAKAIAKAKTSTTSRVKKLSTKLILQDSSSSQETKKEEQMVPVPVKSTEKKKKIKLIIE